MHESKEAYNDLQNIYNLYSHNNQCSQDVYYNPYHLK